MIFGCSSMWDKSASWFGTEAFCMWQTSIFFLHSSALLAEPKASFSDRLLLVVCPFVCLSENYTHATFHLEEELARMAGGETSKLSNWSFSYKGCRRYMVEKLPIRRKTRTNQSYKRPRPSPMGQQKVQI